MNSKLKPLKLQKGLLWCPPPSSFRFHVKATCVFLFCSFSSLPCHWPCSVSSWLGQCESRWNVYKETYSETWSIFNQWLLTRMGILRRVGWNIVIFSVLFVICPSREVHLKRWGSGWDIRWKDSDLFDINGILVPREVRNQEGKWWSHQYISDLPQCT